MTFRNFIFLPLLSLLVACPAGITGDDISGEWEGEVEIAGEDLEIYFELELDEAHEYSGSGEVEWFCQISSGSSTYWDDCTLEFDIEAETEGERGEQEISFELDDCEVRWEGQTQAVDCPDDFELDWDGSDEMEGELEDDSDVSIERN